jgi:tryptophanase
MDIDALKTLLETRGTDQIAFVRMEAGTNLIGGQPFSLENLGEVSALCKTHQVPLVLDASLLSDNLHFIKMREASCKDMSIESISNAMANLCDIIYFSGRKLGSARGGGICTSSLKFFESLRPMIPLYEGFLTYGGMSIKEMEAMAVGIHETLDEDIISQGPQFIEFMTEKLIERGVPVITPAGGLGCHLDAMAFLPHVKQEKYPAGALASAIFLVSGIRGMERGTLSEQRNPDGTEPLANMELVRLALPRRVFTMSHILFAVDRIAWLFENRESIGGLEWIEEPEVLRFFYGKLRPDNDWQKELLKRFEADFGGSC